MALNKTATLASGVAGSYHRIHALRWDPIEREFQCAIALYKDAATAADATAKPIVGEYARLRLRGDKFDEYVGKAKLRGGKDLLALAYDAIAAVSEAAAASGETNPRAYVKTDAGRAFFADAEKV